MVGWSLTIDSYSHIFEKKNEKIRSELIFAYLWEHHLNYG